MPAKKPVTLSKPTLNVQHEFITVNLGNGRRLTTSFSGEKASGLIPMPVFNAWCKMVSEKSAVVLLDRIKAFVDNIDVTWPEWNAPAPTFTDGQEVTFDFGSKRGGVKKGVVLGKKRTSYDVRFEGMGIVGMSADLLAKGSL